MTEHPPRRPRRWSWACTAVVVQVAGVFALAALVAMPERHVDGIRFNGRSMTTYAAFYAWPDNAQRLLGAGGRAVVARSASARVFTVGEGVWLYRDAGPHVLLDGFWEWATQ